MSLGKYKADDSVAVRRIDASRQKQGNTKSGQWVGRSSFFWTTCDKLGFSYGAVPADMREALIA